MKKINKDKFHTILLVLLVVGSIEGKSFLVYSQENVTLLEAHGLGLLHMGLVAIFGGIFLVGYVWFMDKYTK